MSKSEQKRICVQSECAVRDELRSQLDVKENELQKYKDVVQKISDGFYREYGEFEDRNEEYACVMCDKALAKLEGESE